MAERLVAAIQDVLIGPWYGEVFDLLLTDQRFLIVFVSKFNMKYGSETRDLSRYAKESMQVLASGEKAISIRYEGVKEIRQKKGPEGGWHYLILTRTSDDGKAKRVKLMMLPQDIPRMYSVVRTESHERLAPLNMDYEEGIELLLKKAMPGIHL